MRNADSFPAIFPEAGPEPHRKPRRWLWWVAFWGFWTAFGILLATPRVLFVGENGLPAGWGEALRIAVLDMYSWGLVALVAVGLAGRLPLHGGPWPRTLALHAGAGISVLLARFWLAYLLAYALGWIPRMPPANAVLYVLPWNLLFYAAMVGVGYAVDYYRRYRDRELDASRLELEASQLELSASVLQTQLAQAQLQTLKMQLHPHFLFNTLNAISLLVHTDPERAEQMITSLGDLLRAALIYRQQQEVSLREEIDLLAPYLEIEKTRFGDRLTIEISLAPDTLDARIPHLILQPLIENAIKHGIAPRSGPGHIAISAERDGESLWIRVRDNGRGIRQSRNRRAAGDGVGLSNVRARLERLYGDLQRFRIANHPAGGAEAEIMIPYHAEHAEATFGGRAIGYSGVQ